jgi:hypothetical protein
MSERAPYADVGRAMRTTVDLAFAVSPPLKACDWRILAAVVSKLASWSRLEERVYAVEIAEAAGVHPRRAQRSLQVLAAHGVIRWAPVRGSRSRTLLGLSEPQWLTDDSSVSESGSFSVSDSGSFSVSDCGSPKREGSPRSSSEKESSSLDWTYIGEAAR